MSLAFYDIFSFSVLDADTTSTSSAPQRMSLRANHLDDGDGRRAPSSFFVSSMAKFASAAFSPEKQAKEEKQERRTRGVSGAHVPSLAGPSPSSCVYDNGDNDVDVRPSPSPPSPLSSQPVNVGIGNCSNSKIQSSFEEFYRQVMRVINHKPGNREKSKKIKIKIKIKIFY